MNTAGSLSFSHQLRLERIRRNWRQQDLADELGTTVTSVKRWERGSQQPSVYFRVKLCALFERSAEEFGLVTEQTQSTPMPAAPVQDEALIASSSSEMAAEIQTTLICGAIQAMAHFFPSNELDGEDWHRSEQLLPHALTNVHQMQQHITLKTFSRDQQTRTVSNHEAFCVELRRDERPACPVCEQVDEVVCSGVNRAGTRRFRCRSCQRYFTPSTRPRGYHPALKTQALALAEEGVSARTIAQKLEVHHSTVSLWIKALERPLQVKQ